MSEHEHEPHRGRTSRGPARVDDASAEVASDRPVAHLLALQSTAGNAAVTGMLQRSLRVGASSDPLEREADRIADEVALAPGVPAASARKVRPARAGASRATSDDPPPPEGPGGPAGGSVDAGFEQRVQQARSDGTPLPADVRTSMESAFDSDFGHVRLHDGPDAAGMADAIGARAFTTGADIFLGAGAAAPDSEQGAHLLAHELTHVVQQSGGADTTLRRDDLDGGPVAPPVEAPVGKTYTLLEVAERLVDDLSAHKRGQGTEGHPGGPDRHRPAATRTAATRTAGTRTGARADLRLRRRGDREPNLVVRRHRRHLLGRFQPQQSGV